MTSVMRFQLVLSLDDLLRSWSVIGQPWVIRPG
jgi:hypothetical protein